MCSCFLFFPFFFSGILFPVPPAVALPVRVINENSEEMIGSQHFLRDDTSSSKKVPKSLKISPSPIKGSPIPLGLDLIFSIIRFQKEIERRSGMMDLISGKRISPSLISLLDYLDWV